MTVWIQNPFDTLPCEGGRKQRYWLMAEAFLRAGHDVVYFTADFSHVLKRRRTVDAGGLVGLRVVPVATPVYRRNVGLRRVWSHQVYARRWASVAMGSPDLIVSSFPTLAAADMALRLGRKFGARVVIDVQDAWPETFERLFPRGLRGLARLMLWPWRLKARRIFCAADRVTGTCDLYRALTGRGDYYRAYLGIESSSSAFVARAEDSSRSNPIRLVYVGNLGRSYDLDVIARTVEENADFTLDVAGFGVFESSCSRVKMHGVLSEGELRALLTTCTVGIVPMSDEAWIGVPNKMFDYAAAGLRIVSSLTGESAALLAAYRCGVTYCAGDATSLAAAVRKAMMLPIGASRQLYTAEFDAMRIYDDYVREVAAVVSPKP